jgi:hypothetical protein
MTIIRSLNAMRCPRTRKLRDAVSYPLSSLGLMI